MNLNDDLITACEIGNLELVRLCIINGADVEAQNNLAVRWAADNGHLEMVKYIKELK